MNEQSVLHDLVSRNEAEILQRWVDRQLVAADALIRALDPREVADRIANM